MPTIPDFADISDIRRGLSQTFEKCYVICDRSTRAQQLSGLVISEIHRQQTPTSLTVKNFEFSFVRKNRRPSQKSGTRREVETLPILQMCPRSSQTIGDIYDFEFSLVGKIWDGRETVKSQTVWA